MASSITNPDVKGGPKRADYVVYARPTIPVAIIEAKVNKYPVGHGMQQDFAPFGEIMHKITNRSVKKNYEIYLSLYQAVTGAFYRHLVLTQRTVLVAKKVWEYLKNTDPMAKTIVFCDDQPHAERMRQELVKLIPSAASNRRYLRASALDQKAKDASGDKKRKFKDKADERRENTKDEQSVGDRIYWPIFNLDSKNPNAPEEESQDPDELLEKLRHFAAENLQTEELLKRELAAAVAYHLPSEEVWA